MEHSEIRTTAEFLAEDAQFSLTEEISSVTEIAEYLDFVERNIPALQRGGSTRQASDQCLTRIKRELADFFTDPLPGILVVPEENNIKIVHALITGPVDTPYEGGFFYFLLRFPIDYPISPINVQFMTTGGNQVRLNPNFYTDGKVCLSILGTWAGPGWTPLQNLSSVLISIQSLLSEKPYHNEPGFEKERKSGDVQNYNNIIEHETIRVAVLGMVNNDYQIKMPVQFVEYMEKHFLKSYAHYENTARKNMLLTGEIMKDPFGEERGKFNYSTICQSLRDLKRKLEAKCVQDDSSSGTSDLD